MANPVSIGLPAPTSAAISSIDLEILCAAIFSKNLSF